MSKRLWELDALRGLMLVLMTLTHLPTRLSSPLGQPFGYVSAAEGFVLLSAFMAGMVYSRQGYRQGIEPMKKAFWRRALRVYMCQAATLLFLFFFIAAVGMKVDQPAVKDLMSYYLANPHSAFVAGLLLIYEPPLLDILPMYILFMLGSPWLLAWGMRHGWRYVLFVSFVLWSLSQSNLGDALYTPLAAAIGLGVPARETGSFYTFSWQLLWVAGLWLGAGRSAPDARPLVFPRGAIAAAIVYAAVFLVWRHTKGQIPFPSGPHWGNLLFDKWQLGAGRMLNLLALGVLTVRFGPWLTNVLPRQRWLETMGSASLPVFCAHLIVVLLALAFFGSNPQLRAWWVDAWLLASCFFALYYVARLMLWLERPRQPAVVDAGAPAAPAVAAP